MACESSDSRQDPAALQRGWFTTTHWSVILRVRDLSAPEAAAALERLCQTYWYPVYAFIRRDGKDEETAKDLTQAFFVRLLERQDLSHVRAERGKFRSFLLKALRHFLADEWDKAAALKRGGDRQFVSLEGSEAEERYRLEPVDDLSPDKLYDRRWAMAVLEQAYQLLREEYESAGRGLLFAEISRCFSGSPETPSYADISARLGMPENTLKSHVHRMRKRNGELIRRVVADTIQDETRLDEELKHLLEALNED